MVRLRNYFNRASPEILQEEVWFNLLFHFGLRGRETISQLDRTSLIFQNDSEGHRFVSINHSTISKNVKCSLSSKEFSDGKSYRMYENAKLPLQCPVEALILYFSKMKATSTALFPMPAKISKESPIWYCEKKKLGQNELGQMMKKITSKAQLIIA